MLNCVQPRIRFNTNTDVLRYCIHVYPGMYSSIFFLILCHIFSFVNALHSYYNELLLHIEVQILALIAFALCPAHI